MNRSSRTLTVRRWLPIGPRNDSVISSLQTACQAPPNRSFRAGLTLPAGWSKARGPAPWFWDQYTTNENDRADITASPLRATTEQLQGLPKALVITAEADVLRDEGEAYARKLREAGVDVTAVRYEGIIHDFAMLNTLRGTNAAQAAITQAVGYLRTALS